MPEPYYENEGEYIILGRILIAGTNSHCGKTTITCTILESLRKKNLKLSAYKTGPDYIDPQYLRQSGKCEVYNLDKWLMNEESLIELFVKTSRNSDISIIEGAMGLFDGGTNSTAYIAKLLNAPVILVIDAKSTGESAAAIALGFREYDKKLNLAGVILNNISSDYHAKIIIHELEKLNINYLGLLRKNNEISIPERHLGLLPVHENKKKFISIESESEINIDEIIKISQKAPELPNINHRIIKPINKKIIIAVAKDEAFSFYYPESLGVLEELGAKIKFFSPIHDDKLPNAHGYIFGGGFPEMFCEELSRNKSMLNSVRNCKKINNQIILAECGGFMYLCKSITDLNGKKFMMSGVIDRESIMTDKPVIGYMEAKSLRENILCNSGEIIRGHEFHYSRIESDFDRDYAFELRRRNTNNIHFGGYVNENILASYLHINFLGNINLAQKFINSCID